MTLDEYRLFVVLHNQPWCWNCGRSPHSVPKGWGGPWLTERGELIKERMLQSVVAW